MDKKYFYQTFILLVFSGLVFLIIKSTFPKSIFETKQVDTKFVVQDSLMLKAIEEAEKKIPEKPKKDTVVKPKPKPVVPISTSNELVNFYKALYQLKSGKTKNVRIAYFGDSMNDGDLIVQDFRMFFQKEFGGKGVGLVNIYSKSQATRGSVHHKTSRNWKYSTFLKRLNKDVLGISGYTAYASDTISKKPKWVSYTGSYTPQKSMLYNPTLYYGKTDSLPAFIRIDGSIDSIQLKGKRLLNKLRLSSKTLKKLKIFFNTYNTPLYGVNFDNHKGIHIDNFSMRGNSGLPLSLLRNNLMHQFNKDFGYDLIILQFGTNVISNRKTDFVWYKKAMTRVVNHLKKAFPKADILVLSVADKSRKYDTEMKTDSAVYRLIKQQRAYATETNSGYISLYSLMGGENSMLTWVENGLANKDYTHYNSKGSKKIARLLYDKLMKGFKKFEAGSLKSEAGSGKLEATKVSPEKPIE